MKPRDLHIERAPGRGTEAQGRRRQRGPHVSPGTRRRHPRRENGLPMRHSVSATEDAE